MKTINSLNQEFYTFNKHFTCTYTSDSDPKIYNMVQTLLIYIMMTHDMLIIPL